MCVLIPSANMNTTSPNKLTDLPSKSEVELMMKLAHARADIRYYRDAAWGLLLILLIALAIALAR